MKLYVTVGLPRSGKSAWAKTTGWPIVNPDSVRLALHGQRFYGPAEPFVWAVTFAMVEALRLAGHRAIVVDATNVSAKRRKEWEDRYAGAVEWKLIDTSPEECIRRAKAEGDAEIIPVIERMASEWDFPVKWVTPPAPPSAAEGAAARPSPGGPADARRCVTCKTIIRRESTTDYCPTCQPGPSPGGEAPACPADDLAKAVARAEGRDGR